MYKLIAIIILIIFINPAYSQQDAVTTDSANTVKEDNTVFLTDSIIRNVIKKDSNSKVIIRSNTIDLNKYYSSPEFVYTPDLAKEEDMTLWEYLKQKIKEWYYKLFLQSDSDIRVIVFGIILLVVLYILIKKYLRSDVNVGIKRDDNKLNKQPENVSELLMTDYRRLAEQAKKSGEYRSAVRFYYLKLLKNLQEWNIIDYKQSKTNHDYAYEIKDENLRDSFNELSKIFDYVYYGDFDISYSLFLSIEEEFLQILEQDLVENK